MNKKFLSAILFGALMVTSTGTFVSCKDYDDEIDELTTRVDGVESQIKDLEAKINAAKWITNVTPATGGFTVAFSDGTSYTITNGKDGSDGKDGAAGEAGAAGTEWTISEDGYWVCNGEKTTVKAVGQDGAQGEKGEDAQAEVKKENGKWYLWNGTEFEEITVEAPATANVPFYYLDPTDNNYGVLVICDKDGKNEKEIRLPLNEGLAQIMVLDATRNMSISYYRYNGTATWNGARPLPAKGEYLITQPTKSFLIQVTPANYDLAALDLKLVNSKGEEAPVVLGKPTPYVDDLGVQARAVSASGIFEVTVAPKDFDAETIKNWEDNFQGKGLSLVANESVRSTYSTSLILDNVKNIPSIVWGGNIAFTTNGYTISGYNVDLNKGNEVTITPKVVDVTAHSISDGARYVYDAFITMAALSKADSIKNAVTTDGLKLTANGECYLNIYVNYVNAKGQVYKEVPTQVRFYKNAILPEVEDFALATVTHQTSTDSKKQNQLVDFSSYFTKYASDDAARILWNADAKLVKGGIVEINGKKENGIAATWESENEYGDVVTTPITDLVNNIVLCDKDGKNEGVAAKATHLNVKFASNYGSTIDFEKGKITVYATVQMKQADGKYAPAQTIAIPVTLKNPTAEEIAATYAFNPANFKDNTLTVLDATTVKVGDKLTKGNLIFDPDNMEYDDKSISVDASGNVTLIDVKNMGKSYTISGVQTTCLDRKYDVSFAVKFANSKSYELTIPKAFSVACAGANDIKVKYGDLVKNDGYTYNYKLTNFAGVLIPAADISELKFFADKDCTKELSTVNLKITADANKNLTISSTGDKIANDVEVTVYAQFTVDGEKIVKSFKVTITGAL